VGSPPLRVGHADARSPLDIGDECRPELWIRGEAGIIRRLSDQLHPAPPPLFADAETEMVPHHGGISAKFFGVARGAAEDLRQPHRDMVGVIGADVSEHRRQEPVRVDPPVEELGQALEGVDSSGPFVQGRDGVLGALCNDVIICAGAI
jgi:hypothetical protein